jgi:predicted RND superfamily exporter protein
VRHLRRSTRTRRLRTQLTLQRLFLAALVAVTLALGWQAAELTTESDNHSLIVQLPGDRDRDEHFAATFGRDDDLLLAVVHPQLTSEAGLRFLDDVATAVRGLPGVAAVYALTTVPAVAPGEAGAAAVPLLPRPLTGPDLAARVAAALDRHPEVTGLLVSADRRTAGIVIELAPGGDVPGMVVPAVRAVMDARRTPGIELYLTGIAVQKYDVNALVARDQRHLVPLGIATLAAVLLAFFRRPLGVVLPLGVMGVTVVWTLGIYRLAGLELNAISSLLPPVLMVLSLGPSVHLVEAWLESEERDAAGRVAAARRRVTFPAFFCTLTTALGFGSLAASPMPAVRTFGMFAALGVSFAFVLALAVVPLVLGRSTPPASPRDAASHRAIQRVLGRFAALAVRAPGRVVLAFTAVTVVAVAGVPLVRNNTDLVRFFKPTAPLFRDTMAIDARLTGPITLDFVVARRDGRPLTGADDVRRMGAFEAAAVRHEHVSGVTSVVPVLAQLEAAEEGGAVRLPVDDGQTAYLFDVLAQADAPGLLRKLVAPDARAVRFDVRVHVIGTATAAPLAADLLTDAERVFGPAYHVDPAGAFYRVTRDSNALVETQTRSFGLAMALVFAAIGMLFRSVGLLFVVVVANVMPIVWTGGVMGFAGIDLSTGTAMIASSVLGLVVDDTIYYLTTFSRAGTADVPAAVRRATREAGPALVVNNVVLILGFWVGAFGSFKPTIMFSVLSGLTMATALLCDLLVTPALLVLLARMRQRVGRRALAAVFVGTLLATGAARAETVAIPPDLAPALRDAGEKRWARTYVPDEARKVGEVRLVTRGDADVVETLLYTTLLKRAVREIRAKEMRNWPEGRPGRDDALRYVAALEAAERTLAERAASRSSDDRRRRLLIEFVLTPERSAIVLSRFETETETETADDVRVVVREPLAVLLPSRDYVHRNMRLIAADSFEVEGAQLDHLVSPLPGLRSR